MQIGITGGIGSGKTTVCKIVESLGYPVYYADDRGRYLTDNDPDILQRIRAHFGKKVFNNDDTLNRAALSKIVFINPEELEILNGIVHPVINTDYQNWKAQQNSKLVFKEAAIMFETGMYKELEFVICVMAPEELRIKRVMTHKNMSRQDVENRIANQWNDKQRLALAEAIIYADDEQLVTPQLTAIISRLEKRI